MPEQPDESTTTMTAERTNTSAAGAALAPGASALSDADLAARLAEIRARLAAAGKSDPLPWSAWEGDSKTYVEDARGAYVAESVTTSAADLIAHAPADLAYLADAVERLTRERDALAAELEAAIARAAEVSHALAELRRTGCYPAPSAGIGGVVIVGERPNTPERLSPEDVEKIRAAVARLAEPIVETAGGPTQEVPVVNFLRREAGEYAVRAAQSGDFRLRALAQVRERAFDRIADAVEQMLPAAVDAATPTPAAPSPVASPSPDLRTTDTADTPETHHG